MTFKKKVLQNKKWLFIVFFIINIKYFFVNRKKIRGKNNKIETAKNSLYRNVKFNVRGNNNYILIKKRCITRNVSFEIVGDNNTIIVGESINIMEKAEFLIEGNNCSIVIGNNSLFRDVKFFAGESDTNIVIGDNCFCGILSFSTSDFHSIIDLASGKRINPPSSIKVGNDNWITNNVLFNKGAETSDFTVVSPYAIINKKFEQSNIILAGQPARVVKENITWSREKLPY